MRLIDEIRERIARDPTFTQQGLANHLGVTRSAVNLFLRGRTAIPLERFEQILDYLGISGEEKRTFRLRFASEVLVGEPAKEVRKLIQHDARAQERWRGALAATQSLQALAERLAGAEGPVADVVKSVFFRRVLDEVKGLPGADERWLERAMDQVEEGGDSSSLLIYLSGLLLRLGADVNTPIESIERLGRALSPQAVNSAFEAGSAVLRREKSPPVNRILKPNDPLLTRFVKNPPPPGSQTSKARPKKRRSFQRRRGGKKPGK